jgi:hydroxyacyl-ACP dehydratase HTD2-like protein with hotdog domain
VISLPPTISPIARERIGDITAAWTSDPVSIHQLRAYLAATGADLTILDRDPEDIPVPPMFFYSLCRRIVAESALLPDGQHADLGVEGVTGQTVAGGHKAFFHAPLRVGDVLAATERVIDITEKQGRTGSLVFVTTETCYVNQEGQLVVTFQATTVFK